MNMWTDSFGLLCSV